MNKIELTFPVFYHCAIKGACALQQYNCVNVLLCGKPKADDKQVFQSRLLPYM